MKYKNINWIIGISNTVSICILVQIIFELIPLNPFNYSENKIDDINNILLGLTLGFMINSIFYVFTVVIPYELNKQRVYKIIIPYLRDLYNRLNITKLYFESLGDITEKTELLKSKLNFSIKENEQSTLTFNSFTEIDFFENEREQIISNIDVILSNPFLQGLNENLIYSLTKLKSEIFYIAVSRFVEFKKLDSFVFKDFNKYFIEHKNNIEDFFTSIEYLKSKLSIKHITRNS